MSAAPGHYYPPAVLWEPGEKVSPPLKWQAPRTKGAAATLKENTVTADGKRSS